MKDDRSTHTSRRRRDRAVGGPPGVVATEKPKDFKGTIKKLFKYIARYKLRLIIVVVFAMGSAIFNIIGPKILSQAITELFTGLVSKFTSGGAIDFDKIAQIMGGLLIIYLISLAFGVLMGWIMSGVTQRTGYNLRRDISEKIHRMPMKYFESNSVGDVLSRITNDVDTMSQTMNQAATQLITSVTSIIGVIIMMLTISPLMTGIAIIMLPLSIFLIAIIMKFSQKYFNRQQEYLGKINARVEEDIAGHNVVKLFSHEERSKKEFNETNDVLYGSAWKSQFFSGLMMPILNFVGNLGYVGVVIAGGILAFKGTITVGDIQAFIVYVRNFTQPITQLAQIFNQFQSMAAAAERVFAFLSEDEELPDAEDAITLGDAEGHVDFEHIRFGYVEDKIVINGLTEDVDPGQMVAIVGPTGAGKTTLVKLLMRFYDVDEGAIFVDGHDIRTIRRDALRKNFGMVLQDTWLFKGTIMENIKYGRPDASDEEAIEAAKAAHVHRFIQTLPDGYNMVLSESADNISAGQKQLLTIARAILADAAILILDEATSSVDTRTERQIQAAMETLKKGRTSFVIAHRLSTIRNADIILVINDGDVVEQGTHEALLAADGFYAELYNSQFEPEG